MSISGTNSPNHRDSPVTASSSSPVTTTKIKKAATFLTSDSLKEIRNKLRRLSDESLYKDDILNSGSSTSSTCSQLSDQNNEPASNDDQPKDSDSLQVLQRRGSVSAFVDYRSRHQELSSATTNTEMNKFQKSESNSSVGSTTSSIRNEWRRKSYGFEKMTPPETTMSHHCMESSTDSGIGRSGGELSTNAAKNGTIVHISNPAADNYQSYRSSFRNSLSSSVTPRVESNPKRHSIAVADDRRYLSDSFKDSSSATNKPQASVNGFNVIFNSTASGSTNSNTTQSNSKRVEFCKTEVHFAPESGRVNIVETDGKPPPTNNFRRRRSSTQFSSSSTESLEPSYEVQQPADPIEPLNAMKATISTNSSVDSRTEEEVRGILKNKPVKPKPYHLGENCADGGESLFGVRLRPVSADYTNFQPRATPTQADTNSSISLYKEPDSG